MVMGRGGEMERGEEGGKHIDLCLEVLTFMKKCSF